MTKLKYDENSLLAEYYEKTNIDGDIIIHKDGRRTYLLNQNTGSITAVIRWKYEWYKDNTVTDDWTIWEKAIFMRAIYLSVQQAWNGKITYSVSGESEFAKKFQGKALPFDVRIISASQNEDWLVIATKVLPGADLRTYVDFKNSTDHADSADLEKVAKCINCNNTLQVNIPHEAGHVLGYLDDDYDSSSPYVGDISGLMNVGMELRERYLKNATITLNVIMPETKFTLLNITK
ncbi:TPA: hypothetical protein ACNCG2_004356 [Escherichia coli]|uniref:hypothetical protein n=1 Tax=Escherichia coli TaxID=562 RepID=UPI001A911949|nr:hypothetical protein [Escherichia coli]EHP7042751.1 hypothetical protein [Escherichia coli]UUP83256.1 hypothetical protein KFU64_17985 [Escherichia coli]HBI9821959.1 hypothetical protein [Escherichia coli]HBI9832056.1 hypothetical protein [Escherichia coli]HBI9834325.1 hypothetical protein [Escherichia coli]